MVYTSVYRKWKSPRRKRKRKFRRNSAEFRWTGIPSEFRRNSIGTSAGSDTSAGIPPEVPTGSLIPGDIIGPHIQHIISGDQQAQRDQRLPATRSGHCGAHARCRLSDHASCWPAWCGPDGRREGGSQTIAETNLSTIGTQYYYTVGSR